MPPIVGAVLLLSVACRASAALHAHRAPQPRMLASPISRAFATSRRAWLGDETKAPLRSALKQQLERKTAGLVPEATADMALDMVFRLMPKVVPGGLDKLIQPGELQKRRDALRDDVARQLAASLETPLGDEMERRLGGMVVDLVIDELLANSDFLRSPEVRPHMLFSARRASNLSNLARAARPRPRGLPESACAEPTGSRVR